MRVTPSGGRDLTGKVAIVTGGYSGLGLETTKALAGAGAIVIVPARTPEKAQKALAGIANVEQAALDLADPDSIDAFAGGFLSRTKKLDILINNAAIMASPLMRDARGYEAQFATNHLGHFQLTARLWPALKAANGARVVSLSSIGHRICPPDLEDPNFERTEYNKWMSYGRAKSANALFAIGLDKRGAAAQRPRLRRPSRRHHDRPAALHAGRRKARHGLDRRRRQSRRAFQDAKHKAPPPASGARPTRSSTARAASIAKTATSPNKCPPTTKPFTGVRPWAIDPVLADQALDAQRAHDGRA